MYIEYKIYDMKYNRFKQEYPSQGIWLHNSYNGFKSYIQLHVCLKLYQYSYMLLLKLVLYKKCEELSNCFFKV